MDPVKVVEEQILSTEKACQIVVSSNFWYYGAVKNGKDTLVLGPIGNLQLTPNERKELFFMYSSETDKFDSFWNAIESIDNLALQRFAELLCLVNNLFNDEELQYYNLYLGQAEELTHEGAPIESDTTEKHTSIFFEQEMLTYIKNGDTDGLKNFLLTTNYGGAGVSTSDPLRQAKNNFNATATIVSRAAIDVGMDTETALTLSDNYMQLCELSPTIEETYKLLFNMVMDYTERIAAFSGKNAYSSEIRNAIQYMSNHLTENITSQEIADSLYMSDSRLRAKFKQETGMSVHEYLLILKVNEAKKLLKLTDRSIIQIAYYLNFSSQSHFQNIFKSITGITPKQFRNKLSN